MVPQSFLDRFDAPKAVPSLVREATFVATYTPLADAAAFHGAFADTMAQIAPLFAAGFCGAEGHRAPDPKLIVRSLRAGGRFNIELHGFAHQPLVLELICSTLWSLHQSAPGSLEALARALGSEQEAREIWTEVRFEETIASVALDVAMDPSEPTVAFPGTQFERAPEFWELVRQIDAAAPDILLPSRVPIAIPAAIEHGFLTADGTGLFGRRVGHEAEPEIYPTADGLVVTDYDSPPWALAELLRTVAPEAADLGAAVRHPGRTRLE